MSKARDLADLGGVTARLDEVGNSDGALSNRNLIINGAMQVAQRGTSFTGLGTAPTYTLDRWRFADSANPPARYTATQSSDAPSGFASSLKYEVTTADPAVDADELQNVDYFIEAQDLQQLDYGSSGAKDITLSFWVKCSVAQTFGFRLQHEDGGGGYSTSYAVNSANTWEYKTLTLPGNTATNFANDNGRGFRLRWGMCAGANHTESDSTAWSTGNIFGQQENTWVGTTGNTWQITGVQLEVGDTATPFEHRSYGDELARCQRYFQWNPCGPVSFSGGSNQAAGGVSLPAALRATPSITVVNGTSAIDELYVTRRDLTGGLTIYDDSSSIVPKTSYSLFGSCSAGATANSAAIFMAGHWSLDAEL